MTLLSVSNVKGGQGKSTWSAALAGLLRAPLYDLDARQGDSYAWAQAAGHTARLVRDHEAGAVLGEAAEAKGWIVADCPPAESAIHRAALAAASVVVVPVVPSGAQDARAWGRMQDLLREAADFRRQHGERQLQMVLLNCVRPRVGLTADFVDLLQAWQNTKEGRVYVGAVGQRLAYAEHFASGARIADGSQEMEEVTKRIDSLIKNAKLVSNGKGTK